MGQKFSCTGIMGWCMMEHAAGSWLRSVSFFDGAHPCELLRVADWRVSQKNLEHVAKLVKHRKNQPLSLTGILIFDNFIDVHLTVLST
jgi:hypothetical protein